jgi:membrane fusion protein, adhesin transport system
MASSERRGAAAYAQLGAAALVPRAQSARVVARVLFLTLLLVIAACLLAPWQQSISGAGRVIAYAPSERRQTVEAPVNGRVLRWFVHEGARVEQGEALVEIVDNDPQLVERLGTEREAVSQKLENYRERVAMLEKQILSASAGRRGDVSSAEAKLRSAQGKLQSAEQKLAAAEAAMETASLNLGRTQALTARGLSARRDLELATLAATKARTDRDGAQADVVSAVGEVDAARASLDKARADGDNKIQEAESKLRSGQSDLADARASLTRLEVTISRQAGQLVRAPRAGVILQVLALEGGRQVKQGDLLATLVPDTRDRAVELWVDGNDAAIMSEGRRVRLQFEGWPAVQFTGWPSVAVGTFGGVISFIDAHDDGKGYFRAVVVADSRDEPWPEPRFLRQGVRAKGWVLLERVKLGFELWRRFNGFPPMLKDPPGFADSAEKKK